MSAGDEDEFALSALLTSSLTLPRSAEYLPQNFLNLLSLSPVPSDAPLLHSITDTATVSVHEGQIQEMEELRLSSSQELKRFYGNTIFSEKNLFSREPLSMTTPDPSVSSLCSDFQHSNFFFGDAEGMTRLNPMKNSSDGDSLPSTKSNSSSKRKSRLKSVCIPVAGHLCLGSFFTNCDVVLVGSNRLCGSCLEFHYPTCLAYICVDVKKSPFGYRKRTITSRGGTVVDYRFYHVSDDLFACLCFPSKNDGEKKSTVTTACDTGLLFFKNEDDAKEAHCVFSKFIFPLDQVLHPKILQNLQQMPQGFALHFQKCGSCARKVFPSDILYSCMKPSCAKTR